MSKYALRHIVLSVFLVSPGIIASFWPEYVPCKYFLYAPMPVLGGFMAWNIIKSTGE